MACNCTKVGKVKFRWTDGTAVIDYDTEMAAKAKVLRRGGTYTTVDAVTGAPVE